MLLSSGARDPMAADSKNDVAIPGTVRLPANAMPAKSQLSSGVLQSSESSPGVPWKQSSDGFDFEKSCGYNRLLRLYECRDQHRSAFMMHIVREWFGTGAVWDLRLLYSGAGCIAYTILVG